MLTTLVDGAHPWAPEPWVDVGEKHGLHRLNASPQCVSHPQRKDWLYAEAPSRQPLSATAGDTDAARCTREGPTSFRRHRGPDRTTPSAPGQHQPHTRPAAPCHAAADTAQGTEIGTPGRPRARPAHEGPRLGREVSETLAGSARGVRQAAGWRPGQRVALAGLRQGPPCARRPGDSALSRC